MAYNLSAAFERFNEIKSNIKKSSEELIVLEQYLLECCGWGEEEGFTIFGLGRLETDLGFLERSSSELRFALGSIRVNLDLNRMEVISSRREYDEKKAITESLEKATVHARLMLLSLNNAITSDRMAGVRQTLERQLNREEDQND